MARITMTEAEKMGRVAGCMGVSHEALAAILAALEIYGQRAETALLARVTAEVER